MSTAGWSDPSTVYPGAAYAGPSTTPRSFVVLLVGAIGVLFPFLGFVALGWPGAADSCIQPTAGGQPNSCYCEAFDPAVVQTAMGGVRQVSNTWFNLYALGTGLIVAWRVYADRKYNSQVLIKSRDWIPDVYVFAVLFLGLGSMWFHASLKGWAGNFDGLSMYAYAGFLVFFTLVRLTGNKLWFWIGYPASVVVFTTIHALWDWQYKSLILIVVEVVAYLVFEFWIWGRDKNFAMGQPLPIVLWLLAVVSIISATAFWILSQTGGSLCHPESAFQPHGMLWHPLAGVMAVLLYFYWRQDRVRVPA